MHRFCKVVTSVDATEAYRGMYMHRFCKVVTSVHPRVSFSGYCICIDFVRLLHPQEVQVQQGRQMYMHRFCKVVTSGTMTSRLSTTVVVTSKVSHAQ